MTLEILYWGSTMLLSLLYLSSAAIYLAKGEWVRQTLAELNYPAPYLVPFMVVVKIAAPAAILLRLSPALSDLAYAGILFHLVLSGTAHLGVRKPTGAIPAVIGLLCVFHGRWASLPRDRGHGFHGIVGSHSTARAAWPTSALRQS